MPFYTNKSKTLTHVNRIAGENFLIWYFLGFSDGMLMTNTHTFIRCDVVDCRT